MRRCEEVRRKRQDVGRKKMKDEMARENRVEKRAESREQDERL
jgi:hypothetical protein